jgi:hypothetical protein
MPFRSLNAHKSLSGREWCLKSAKPILPPERKRRLQERCVGSNGSSAKPLRFAKNAT